MKTSFSHIILMISLLATVKGMASDHAWELDLETGAVWQNSNTIQIPNELTGTRFRADEITGNGPWANIRLNGAYNFNGKHSLRFVLAPLSYDEIGQPPYAINFAGESFNADAPLQLSYQFNSWRIGYRYQFLNTDNSNLWFGVTGKIRDAEIKLQQNGLVAIDDNTGFVPLLYVAAEHNLNNKWSLYWDLDGLAGGPGRAIDFSVRINYEVNENLKVGLGYRLLEGGVDNDDVYNFALFNSLFLNISTSF